MEIKAILEKPYTEKEKNDFIVENNHKKGYEIKETDVALEAWGLDDNELLTEAKQRKYEEATNKAKEYLEGGNALFEFEEGKHIEATDGNIAKMTAYALAFVTGQLQPEDKVVWNTKEDETVELAQEQIAQIIAGLGQVQAAVWAVEFPLYVQAIEEAETIEDVEAIIIEYGSSIVTEEESQDEEENSEPKTEETEELQNGEG